MRKLWLINDLGEEYRFDYSSMTLISSITGLGFQKTNTYFDFDNIYKKIDETIPTQDIVFNLAFLRKYQGFKRFLSFLETSHELKLYYTSDDTKYSYVEVESLSKTEISGGTLTSEIKLKRLSYWYKDVISEVTIRVSKEGKIYPFAYPYKYSVSSKGKMMLTNNGYAKAPLKIIIKGEVSNPEVIVTKDGIEVSKLKIYYESNNCTIVVDAFPTRQEITIEENNEKINAYEYQDFSCDNFIFLERGTYELTFVPNTQGSPSCSITMIEGYLGN